MIWHRRSIIGARLYGSGRAGSVRTAEGRRQPRRGSAPGADAQTRVESGSGRSADGEAPRPGRQSSAAAMAVARSGGTRSSSPGRQITSGSSRRRRPPAESSPVSAGGSHSSRWPRCGRQRAAPGARWCAERSPSSSPGHRLMRMPERRKWIALRESPNSDLSFLGQARRMSGFPLNLWKKLLGRGLIRLDSECVFGEFPTRSEHVCYTSVDANTMTSTSSTRLYT